MSDCAPLVPGCAMSDGGEASDSGVVADTYGGGFGDDGVSAGQSRFSAGRAKRLKVDDAPTSASTLSEEQVCAPSWACTLRRAD